MSVYQGFVLCPQSRHRERNMRSVVGKAICQSDTSGVGAFVPRKRSPTLSWRLGSEPSSRYNWCNILPHHRAPASQPRNTHTHVLYYFGWGGWHAEVTKEKKQTQQKHTKNNTDWVGLQDFWMVQLPRGCINFLPS